MFFSILLSTEILSENAKLSSNVAQLEFIAAYPIDGPKKLQPSGLTLLKSNLYMVSDKHPNKIFKMVHKNGVMKLETDQSFKPPKKKKKLDLEGLTVDGYGSFYVLSERYKKVYKVNEGKLELVPLNNWGLKAKQKGFFKLKNAGPEGLAMMRPNLFAIAAERAPRGVLVTDHSKTTIQKLPNTLFNYSGIRKPDLSGLFFYKDQLWGIARNAESIVRLVYKDGGYVEDYAYSFAHTTFNQLYQYRKMRFGMAEGLAIDDKHIYIVLDNNGVKRNISKDDKRPLLLVFKNPLSKQRVY